MEHTGSVRPIQGGGSGIGFHAPRSILRAEPLRFLAISKQMLIISHERRKENSVARVWADELVERMFYLKQRKTEVSLSTRSMSIPAMSRCSLIPGSTSISKSCMKDGNCISLAQYNEDLAQTPHNQTIVTRFGHKKRTIAWLVLTKKLYTKGNMKEQSRSTMFMTKIIPGIPKSIEEVVKVWRKGCINSKLPPVRLFMNMKHRRELITGYSNKMWERSGQKFAFLRLKKLARIVAQAFDDRLQIDAEGTDCDWNIALEYFHRKWDKEGKPIALSKLLKTRLNN